jgi:hypothetical protein
VWVASITVDKTLSEVNFEDVVVAADEICSCDTLCTTEGHLLVTETRVEAGSNTSTVTLRVVRGDEMGLKEKRPRHSLSG